MDCANSIHKAHLISAVNHLPSTGQLVASIKISETVERADWEMELLTFVIIFSLKTHCLWGKEKKPVSINLSHKLYC